MELAKKIKNFRKKKGWSQEELAKRININSAHLSRLENGKYLPSIDLLKKLSEIFEVSTDYLLSDTNEEAKEIKIEDETLANRIKLLNSLDGKDKETIINVIDAILTKKKMFNLLVSEKE